MAQTLVTEERYRDLTKDLTTSQADVLTNLERAVRAAAGALNRPEGGLQSAVRTETGWSYGGAVAPICTPVTSGPTIEPVAGEAFADAWAWAGFTSVDGKRRRRVTMTYTGGWTAFNGATPLPQDIEDAIVAAAYSLSTAVPTPGLDLVGATQRTVGDVSVSYAKPLAGAGQIPAGMFDSIRRYRYRGLGAV
jgi:hypothetical protein